MRRSALLLIVLVCGLTISSPAAPPLADQLPAGTLLYAGWAGRSLTFDGSVTGQLLNEPVVGRICEAIKTLAHEELRGEEAEQFDHLWAMGGIAWEHPSALALLDVRMGERQPTVAVVLLIELGTDRDAFAPHLEALVQSIADEELPVTEETVGDVTYRKKPLIHELDDIGEFAFGFKGEDNVFFLAIGPGAARQWLESSAAGCLTEDPQFEKCWQEVGGENEQLAFYVDVTELLERIETMIAPPPPGQGEEPETQEVSPVRKAMDALGVGGVTAIAGCTRIVERGMYTKAKLFSPAPHKGLLMPLAGAPLTEEELACVPEDAIYLGAIRLSPEAAWAEVRSAIRQIDPAAEDQLLGEMAELDEELGVSITNEILPSLGDTMVLSSAPSQGGFLTGTVLSVAVKDVEKLSAAIAKLEAWLTEELGGPEGEGGVTIETTTAGRAEIHYLAVSGPFPFPVAPAWVIHKDRLYLAGWPQVLASVVESNGPVRPLIAEANYQKLRSKVSPRPSVLTYVNTPEILRRVYHWALLGWTMGANAASRETPVRTRPDWLPSLATLERYLWPEVSTVSADESGITLEAYGSLPSAGAAFAPGISPLSLAILVPSVTRARTKASEAVSAANLHGIGQAIALYAGEHDDEYPPNLAILVEEEHQPEGLLVSPLSGRDPPQLIDGELVGEIDYEYVKLPKGAPGDLVMAYERLELARDGQINVLFADGHVERMPVPWFLEALERTKEYVEQAEGEGQTADF